MKPEYYVFILMIALVFMTSLMGDVSKDPFYLILMSLGIIQILLIAALNIKKKRQFHGVLIFLSLALVMFIVISMFKGII